MNSISKIVFLAVVKLSLICATNGALAGDANTKSSKYSDKINKFSIEYPVTWSSEKGSGPPGDYNVGLFAPKDNPEDKFSENCNVIAGKKPKNMSLDAFAKVNMSNQRKYMPSYHLFYKGKENIGGINSVWSVYSYNLQENNLKARNYYLMSREMVYAITCIAEPDKYSKYEPVFKNIANSFHAI